MNPPKEKPVTSPPSDGPAQRTLRFDAPHKPIPKPWFWLWKKK